MGFRVSTVLRACIPTGILGLTMILSGCREKTKPTRDAGTLTSAEPLLPRSHNGKSTATAHPPHKPSIQQVTTSTNAIGPDPKALADIPSTATVLITGTVTLEKGGPACGAVISLVDFSFV